MIRKFKNWCETRTFNDWLKDLIDTLFIFSLVLSVLFMHYKSGQCITTYIDENGKYQKEEYKLEYTKYQIKAINLMWNVYINVLPEVLIIYFSFLILFIRKKRSTLISEQSETDIRTKRLIEEISEEI